MGIKKIVGSILILVEIFLLLLMFTGLMDNDVELNIKIGAEIMILIPFLLILFFIKCLFKKENSKHKTKNKQKANMIETYIIEFPFYGCRELTTETGVEDTEFFEGEQAYSLLSAEDIDAIEFSWNGSNMTEFIHQKIIKDKINDMQFFMYSDGYCRIFVTVVAPLTDDEKEYILNFVTEQVSDGWRERDFDFIDDKNNKFSVVFWREQSDWYIKYIEKGKFDFKRINIKPMESINGIKFGTKRNKIHSIWGKPEDFSRTKNGDIYGFCLVFYDENECFEAIEIADDGIDICYEDEILPKKYSEILKMFKNKFNDIEEDGNGFVSKNGSLGVFIENGDDIFDAILFGRKNYYN